MTVWLDAWGKTFVYKLCKWCKSGVERADDVVIVAWKRPNIEFQHMHSAVADVEVVADDDMGPEKQKMKFFRMTCKLQAIFLCFLE